MGILSDFERRLEGVIEGIFTKAFRTGLQPVELATRILREMEDGKTVGVHEVWVPNRYTFWLSETDRERFSQTERALLRELRQVVEDGARERGWALVGPPEVVFETDPSLGQGVYTSEAGLVEGPPGASGQSPAVDSSMPPKATVAPVAELVTIERGRAGSVHPLSRDRTIIGRLAESDVVVADPGVSRRHAEVRRENGRFVISDLGSTNGTLVNGASIGERTLEQGDRISIGRTVLEFRRR